MVDFNQGLSFGDALHRCQALDDQGLFWFEEPIQYDNLAGAAELARRLKTPLQLGENFYGPRDLALAIQAGACRYVMPDLMRIGGVTGWQRAAAIAGAAGIEMSSHLYPELSAHLLRVTESAHWLEWQDWANPILAEPFALEAGHIVIPEVAGSGIAWDEQAVAQYRLDDLKHLHMQETTCDGQRSFRQRAWRRARRCWARTTWRKTWPRPTTSIGHSRSF